MRPRVTEPQLMLAIILFVVFAFLMQGRAHGAEYKVEDKSYAVMGVTGVRSLPQFYVGDIVLTDKEQAYDLAYALNRAHEERTTKKTFKRVEYRTKKGDVVGTCDCPESGRCPNMREGDRMVTLPIEEKNWWGCK